MKQNPGERGSCAQTHWDAGTASQERCHRLLKDTGAPKSNQGLPSSYGTFRKLFFQIAVRFFYPVALFLFLNEYLTKETHSYSCSQISIVAVSCVKWPNDSLDRNTGWALTFDFWVPGIVHGLAERGSSAPDSPFLRERDSSRGYLLGEKFTILS